MAGFSRVRKFSRRRRRGRSRRSARRVVRSRRSARRSRFSRRSRSRRSMPLTRLVKGARTFAWLDWTQIQYGQTVNSYGNITPVGTPGYTYIWLPMCCNPGALKTSGGSFPTMTVNAGDTIWSGMLQGAAFFRLARLHRASISVRATVESISTAGGGALTESVRLALIPVPIRVDGMTSTSTYTLYTGDTYTFDDVRSIRGARTMVLSNPLANRTTGTLHARGATAPMMGKRFIADAGSYNLQPVTNPSGTVAYSSYNVIMGDVTAVDGLPLPTYTSWANPFDQWGFVFQMWFDSLVSNEYATITLDIKMRGLWEFYDRELVSLSLATEP